MPLNPLPTAPGRLHFLLVEDNGIIRRYITGLLSSLGHQVSVAHDGSEALKVLQRIPCDVVLMDVRMPVMDGESAIRAIRSGQIKGVDPRVPVIALSAQEIDPGAERLLRAGASAYLAKPFETQELIGAVSRVLADAYPLSPGSPPPPLPDGPWLDLQAALARVRGNEAFLARMYRLFLDEWRGRALDLAKALASENRVEVFEAAHSLANSLSVLGAAKAELKARELQRLARQDAPRHSLIECAAGLETAIELSALDMRTWLDAQASPPAGDGQTAR